MLDREGAAIADVWLAYDPEIGLHMGRTDFINSFFEKVSVSDALRLARAARAHAWAEIDAFHPEALPWYCRSCGCNYAESQWKVQIRFDEDDPGWVDSYRGWCPQGHERMIAD